VPSAEPFPNRPRCRGHRRVNHAA